MLLGKVNWEKMCDYLRIKEKQFKKKQTFSKGHLNSYYVPEQWNCYDINGNDSSFGKPHC